MLLDACFVGGVALQDVLGGGLGQRDVRLFFFQNLDRDGIGVVGLEHLLALVVELSEPALGFLGLAVEEREHGLDVVPDHLSDLIALLLGQCHGLPVSLDQVFGQLDGDGTLVAAVLQALPAEAVEVAVQVPLAVPRYGKAVRLPAPTAEDRAFEVVRADPWLLLALNAACPHCLYAVVEIFVDQRFVVTGVLDSLEGDHADVVAVLEDAVDVRCGERLRWFVRSDERCDAAFREVISQHHHCPLARGVALEQFGHDGSPLRINDDGAYLAPVLGALPDVEVAEGCHARGAATLGLLEHALA
nr:hypothetical protein [Kribbella sindirgiensis]